MGSVHEKCVPCLQSLALRSFPWRKFVRPPTSQPFGGKRRDDTEEEAVGRTTPPGAVISPVAHDDMHVVVGVDTPSPRRRAYIASKLHQSTCIRVPAPSLPVDDDIPDSLGMRDIAEQDAVNEHTPIAWALLDWDGSIGPVYVDPESRRRGLATLVLNQLVRSLDGPNAGLGPVISDVGARCVKGGAAGWNWVDIQGPNSAAIALYGHLVG